MTDPDHPTGPTEDLRVSHPPAPRRLTRSSSDRLLGGVSGGLGRYFAVDPVLFRIAFVVLTFVGGAGACAYLGAWLFIPSEDAPLGPPTLRRRALAVTGAVVLVLAIVPFLDGGLFLGGALVPLAILGFLIVLLARTGREGTGDDVARLFVRVALALLAAAAAFVGVLGVGAAAAFGGDVVIAILLVLAGAGLLVGAFVGGARWLIVPALLIALPLGVVAAADLDMDGGVGDRTYRPSRAADVRPVYELGAGQLVVDLRDVRLPPGQTDLQIDLGMGEAVVFVPDGVCVASDIKIGAGHAQVLGREHNGLDVDWQETPRAGSAPRLHVDADVGMGAVEVVRSEGFLRTRDGDWFGPRDFLQDPLNDNRACAQA